MSKKFQLQIPEPCHENWDKMNPTDHGRFCSSCQKAVVDFTGMSDAQLVAFFKKSSTGSVCGRFNDDQLQRNITIPGKRMPWFKYILQICLPIFLTSTKAISQGKPRVTTTETTETCIKPLGDPHMSIIAGKVMPNIVKTQLTGRVVNEDGEPIPFASVLIKGSKKGTTCDAAGYFELATRRGDKFVTLIATSIGYERSENIFSNNPGSINKIILRNEAFVLKEVVVTSTMGITKGLVTTGFVVNTEEQETLSGRLGGVCVKPVAKDSVLTTIKKFFVNDSLKVYPNPARRDGSLKIETISSDAGELQIELFNLQGQLINSSKINHDEKNYILTYQLPNVIGGAYILRITNKKTWKTQTEKIIIQ